MRHKALTCRAQPHCVLCAAEGDGNHYLGSNRYRRYQEEVSKSGPKK